MAQNVNPRKIKLSKIAIVMFLTVLIWVYADLALDETHLVPNVPIIIAGNADSALWATFKDEDGSPLSTINIEHLVLKGPASTLATVKRDLNSGVLRLAFSLNPEAQNMTTAGSHSLDVLDFVRKQEQIRALGGLVVESCEPKTITVDVAKLVAKELDIQAFDESGRPLEAESISPPKVSMFVPGDWGQDRAARVKFTLSEVRKARAGVISKRPYVELADGQQRRSETPAQIKLRPEEEQLETYTITRATVGFCFSENTQGKFNVELGEEEPEIVIQATPAAKQAYEQGEKFKLILEIYDLDSPDTEISRAYKYNFPEEYVRSGQIKVDPARKAQAIFKLIRQPSPDGQ